MRIALFPLAAAAALALAVPAAQARDTSRLFLGIGVNFGQRMTPEALVGVSHAGTSASGKVTGFKAELGLDMQRGFQPSEARLSALYGHSATQLELGGGYNFEDRSAFGLGGLNGNHYALGGTFSPTSGLGGYAHLQTLGKLNR